jgi:hypothetical protein
MHAKSAVVRRIICSAPQHSRSFLFLVINKTAPSNGAYLYCSRVLVVDDVADSSDGTESNTDHGKGNRNDPGSSRWTVSGGKVEHRSFHGGFESGMILVLASCFSIRVFVKTATVARVSRTVHWFQGCKVRPATALERIAFGGLMRCSIAPRNTLS